MAVPSTLRRTGDTPSTTPGGASGYGPVPGPRDRFTAGNRSVVLLTSGTRVSP